MGDGTKENPLTREDVLRLIKENGGTAKGLDLSGKHFEEGVDLSGLNLDSIILNNAFIAGACLKNACLVFAKLQGAFLWEADLRGADLTCAKVQETDFWLANLQNARFVHTQISQSTNFRDVDWGNYFVQEENEGLFGEAAASYRQLKIWYANTGYSDIAAKFYYREKEANRKSIKLFSEHLNDRLAAEFMRAFFGYGEKWQRILIWMAVFVFGLAAAYYFLGSFSSSSFLDSLYYSAISFTALGYGKWAAEPIGWVKAMGVAEAFIGVFMMALLLVTFVRKWTR